MTRGVFEVLKRFENSRIMFPGEDKFVDGTVVIARGLVKSPEALRVYGYQKGGGYSGLSRAIVNRHEIDVSGAEYNDEGEPVLRPVPLLDEFDENSNCQSTKSDLVLKAETVEAFKEAQDIIDGRVQSKAYSSVQELVDDIME